MTAGQHGPSIVLAVDDHPARTVVKDFLFVQDARAMRAYPHVIFFPAAAIFLTIFAFNTLGNGLRDRLDPKSR